ncbi:MAG: DUF982 domain-containing protein [Mesorhizobium sp.]|jgi:hypothetical protein
MIMNAFKLPVDIFVGLGFSRQVGGVGEAHRVLSEWPATGRGPVHAAALAACWSALTGQSDADMARLEFVRFAKERGILASEASDPAGWRAA